MLAFSSGAQFNPRRYRPRSWTQKYSRVIGLVLILVGFAALGAAGFFKLTGGPALALRGFGVLALFFARGFLWNRGPIFPPSPVNRANRWKYLTVLAILWLIILPIAWWFAARALEK